MSIFGKKGSPRFVSRSELSASISLMQGLEKDYNAAQKALDGAIQACLERNVILHLSIEKDGKEEDIYFINTPPDMQALEKIKSGELKLPEVIVRNTQPSGAEDTPNIFSLYEDNIGMLTPLIADELREAEKLYPANWFAEAFKIAVSRNIRKWDYISAILERWSREGKDDGTHRRNAEKEGPEKYAKQKYGHMVQH